jgi:type VI secretion system protein ImpL
MNFDLPALLRKALVPFTSAAIAIFGYQVFFVAESIPWFWIAVFVAVSLTGVATFFLVRRWRRRRAERAQSAPIAPVVVDSVKEKAEREDALKSLQRNWKEAVEFLRGSRLKKSGDPLYALPWFMVIGAPNSGKTAAIRGARLSSFAENAAPVEIAGTKNCEWSFFEQAIVIDTAGRYSSHNTPGLDKDE